MTKSLTYIIIIIVVLFHATLLVTNSYAQTGTSQLEITLTGFENSNGVAMVALVNSKENYSEEKSYKAFMFDITDKKAMKTIILPYGEYAIKAYHDENSNAELDSRMFGIPVEKYGFSNNVMGKFGPPEYEKASFKVDSPQKTIQIKLQ